MNRTWVTLLTRPGFLPGVRALAASLRDVGSRHRLLVMVPPDLDQDTRRALEHSGCAVHEVERLMPTDRPDYAAERFTEVWTKLQVFGLTEYERVVFLDADMLLLRRMDELFDPPLTPDTPLAAVPACQCNPNRVATYPDHWTTQNCPYNNPHPSYFNSGLLVLQPEATTLDALRTRMKDDDCATFAFADQDLLNQHFAGRWRPLPYTYNALKTLRQSHPDLWNIQDVHNIHYIQEKPWEADPTQPGPYHDLYQKWWDIAEA
ncbi:glycosyltransferase family 8 protein [Streptomyces sp. NPDC050523]|uniref:glycosyltransferase family 8 protein n=1 Tax=Streptomyces sp. NPDC050523 TaxID=3365622 RepID=UPI003787D693